MQHCNQGTTHPQSSSPLLISAPSYSQNVFPAGCPASRPLQPTQNYTRWCIGAVQSGHHILFRRSHSSRSSCKHDAVRDLHRQHISSSPHLLFDCVFTMNRPGTSQPTTRKQLAYSCQVSSRSWRCCPRCVMQMQTLSLHTPH